MKTLLAATIALASIAEVSDLIVDTTPRYKNSYLLRGITNFKYPNARRNNPCPCESGKKFKKCCINKFKD